MSDDWTPPNCKHGAPPIVEQETFAGELARQRAAEARINACEHEWLDPKALWPENEDMLAYCQKCQTKVYGDY